MAKKKTLNKAKTPKVPSYGKTTPPSNKGGIKGAAPPKPRVPSMRGRKGSER